MAAKDSEAMAGAVPDDGEPSVPTSQEGSPAKEEQAREGQVQGSAQVQEGQGASSGANLMKGEWSSEEEFEEDTVSRSQQANVTVMRKDIKMLKMSMALREEEIQKVREVVQSMKESAKKKSNTCAKISKNI